MQKLNLTEATCKALENKLNESIEEETSLYLDEMKQRADEIYDLWQKVDSSVRENLDIQFDDDANISYCIRWLTQALDDITGDWDNVKADLMKNND